MVKNILEISLTVKYCIISFQVLCTISGFIYESLPSFKKIMVKSSGVFFISITNNFLENLDKISFTVSINVIYLIFKLRKDTC